MKFKKYIKEANSVWEDAGLIAGILENDCMPFIKEMKSNNLHNWFYRATEHHYKIISKPIKPRKDRRPRNTPKELHEYMNKLFKKKFGWNVRSEGIFAGSDRNQLEYTYGDPYLFFPIGNYKYVYHPQMRDIFMHLDGKYNISYIGDPQVTDLDEYFDTDQMYKIYKEIDNIVPQYKNKNLSKAYVNIVEVAFKCKSYYLVNEKYSDDLKKYLEW